MKQVVMDEIDHIAEVGLTPTNLERAYKLVDIAKDIYEANMYERQTMTMGIGAGTDHRKTSSDDAYVQYLTSKKDYRYDKSDTCKQKLMDTLDEYMDSFADKMEMMLQDAECKEERDTIHRYLQRLESLR